MVVECMTTVKPSIPKLPLLGYSNNFLQPRRMLSVPVSIRPPSSSSSRQNSTMSTSLQCRCTMDDNFTETKPFDGDLGLWKQFVPKLQTHFIKWMSLFMGLIKDMLSGAISKLKKKEPKSILFNHLVGLDAPITELKKILYALRRSRKSFNMAPEGVLLLGPDGTGKTALANALAYEAKVSFFPVLGEDIVKNQKGDGVLKSIFAEARFHAPSIIFIDGLECVKATSNLVLEMIECKKNGVLVHVVATTTETTSKIYPKLLNLFSNIVNVEKPDQQAREEMADVLVNMLNASNDDKSKICRLIVFKASGLVWGNLVNVLDCWQNIKVVMVLWLLPSIFLKN